MDHQEERLIAAIYGLHAVSPECRLKIAQSKRDAIEQEARNLMVLAKEKKLPRYIQMEIENLVCSISTLEENLNSLQ